MRLGLNEIMSVIDKVKNTGLTAFEYQDADIRLKIGNKNAGNAGTAFGTVCGAADSEAYGMAPVTENVGSSYGAEQGIPYAADSAPLQETEDVQQAGKYVSIESPMVGTFYAAASEKEEPFVKVGDTVKAGQTVGIVEAMKLMNEIEAECSGTVEEILVENGQMVEYGQTLMRVRTDVQTEGR